MDPARHIARTWQRVKYGVWRLEGSRHNIGFVLLGLEIWVEANQPVLTWPDLNGWAVCAVCRVVEEAGGGLGDVGGGVCAEWLTEYAVCCPPVGDVCPPVGDVWGRRWAAGQPRSLLLRPAALPQTKKPWWRFVAQIDFHENFCPN